MKRFFVVIFAAMFLFSGCGSDSSSKTEPPKEKVEQSKPEPPKKLTQEEKIVQEEPASQVTQEEIMLSEKDAFQKWESRINFGINKVDEHWETLWQHTLNNAANGSIDPQTVFQNLRELEHKLIDDEMIFQMADIPDEMSSDYGIKMNNIRQGFADWAKLRRKACENFRFALGTDNLTPQVMQESVNIINQADAFMLRSTAILVELENEINNR